MVPDGGVPNMNEEKFNLLLSLKEKSQYSSKYNNELKLQISKNCYIFPISSMNNVPLKLETCKLNTNYMFQILASPHAHTVGAGKDHPTVQFSLRNQRKWRDTVVSDLQQS